MPMPTLTVHAQVAPITLEVAEIGRLKYRETIRMMVKARRAHGCAVEPLGIFFVI
jgi:5-enolpyruvylshikimate-3-phosphate synthase